MSGDLESKHGIGVEEDGREAEGVEAVERRQRHLLVHVEPAGPKRKLSLLY